MAEAEVLEAEGGAVPTVSSLFPFKERCLQSHAGAEGGGRRRGSGRGRRRWRRVAEAEGGGGCGGRQRLEDE